tara:strand:- start:804 stop:1463 length:660 start_codon:yes stop_codon:yes gene_type:complete
MKEQKISYNIYSPFGPRVMKASIPQLVVDAVNMKADEILGDEDIIKKLDYSGNLAGNVKTEVALSLSEVKGLDTLINKLSTEYILKTIPGQFDPTKTNMTFSSWVVSQYAGDFNPLHVHDAQLSGVFFLRLPPKYEEEYRREDHHPTVGCLEFLGGAANTFSKHSYLVKPEIGDLYLFPSWLTHQVYPFRSEGERRSMSFNIHLRAKAPGTDVGKGIDV